MRPDVPRPPRERGARPPVASPLARRVRVLLALALAGLVAMTIGAAQVPAAVDVPVPADVPANVPVPADAPAGGEVPTAGTDYDWPVAGDPPEVLRPFDPPPRPWLPGHRGGDLSARDGAEGRAAGPGTVALDRRAHV